MKIFSAAEWGKIIEGRNIALLNSDKNNKTNVDRLLTHLSQHSHKFDQEFARTLFDKQTVDKILGVTEDIETHKIQVQSRFYKKLESQAIYASQEIIQRDLLENNRDKVNIFQEAYEDNDRESKEGNLKRQKFILLIVSPIDILNINFAKSAKGQITYKLVFYSSKINNNFYAYSYVTSSTMTANLEDYHLQILTLNEHLSKSPPIKISKITKFTQRYHGYGLIAIDLTCAKNYQQARNIGVIYSIPAVMMSTQYREDQLEMFGWLALLYNALFLSQKAYFERINDFIVKAPFSTPKRYAISRFYVYMLIRLSGIKKMKQFLQIKTKLLGSLQYPIINHKHVEFSFLREMEGVYKSKCLQYSIEIDNITLKVSSLKNLIQTSKQQDAARLMKDIYENQKNILENVSLSELVRFLSNEYIDFNAAISIFADLLNFEKNKKEVEKDFQTSLINLFKSFSINRNHRQYIIQQKQVRKQQIQKILIRTNGKFAFLNPSNLIIFYTQLKMIKQSYPKVYELCYGYLKQILVNALQKVHYSKDLFEMLHLNPTNYEDNVIIKSRNWNIRLARLAQFQDILYRRFINPSSFNVQEFDRTFNLILKSSLQLSKQNIIEMFNICQKLQGKFQAKRRSFNEQNLRQIERLMAPLITNLKETIAKVFAFTPHYFKQKENIFTIICAFVKIQSRNIRSSLKKTILQLLKDQNKSISLDEFSQALGLNKGEQISEHINQFYQQAMQILRPLPNNENEAIEQLMKELGENRCYSSLIARKHFSQSMFQNLLEKIKEKFKNNSVFCSDLEKIYKNKKQLLQIQQSLSIKFFYTIEGCDRTFKQFRENCLKLKEILSHQDKCKYYLQQVIKIQQSMGTYSLKQLYQLIDISDETSYLLKVATQFRQMIEKSQYFQKQRQYEIKELLSIHQTWKNNLEGQINRLLDDNLLLEEYFRISQSMDIQKCCIFIFGKEKSQKLLKQIYHLKKDRLKIYYDIAESINQLTIIIQKKDDIICKRYLETYKMINQEKKTKVQQFLLIVLQLINYIKDKFNLAQKCEIFKNEVLQVIKQTFLKKEMFSRIRQSGIDDSVILNFKESLLGPRFSNITIDNIKELQEVMAYQKQLSQFTKIQHLANYIKKQFQNNQTSLSVYIKNSYELYQQIIEKSKQVQEKQDSFRQLIKQILDPQNNSEFCIVFCNQKYLMNYYIEIKPQLRVSHQKTLQELRQYRQSCLIFSSQVDGKAEHQTIKELLKDYIDFFNKIERLCKSTNYLLQSGYDYNSLQRKLKISNVKVRKDGLIQQIQKLQDIAQRWKKLLEQSYLRSFLFTFYQSKEVYELVQSIFSFKPNQKLHKLSELTKQQLQEIYNQKQFNSQSLSIINLEIHKLQKAVEFLQEVQFIMKKSKIQKSEGLEKNKIVLNFVKQQQYVLCYQNIPKFYQVFFCLNTTTLLQLQIFLYRCFKSSQSAYYIVEASNLRQQLKRDFYDQIKKIYQQYNTSKRSIELHFIDQIKTDILYDLIRWSNAINVIQRNSQKIYKKLEENKQSIRNVLNNVEVITSARPGLGKTYYVQRKARTQNKTLYYFPICGNIRFDDIMKRLSKIEGKEGILLIQIGHVEDKKDHQSNMNNLQKLQIVLIMIVLLKSFYHKGIFIYLKSQLQIFIELENLYQIEKNKGQQIKRTNLRQKSIVHEIKKKHIQRFNTRIIDFQQKDKKQLFVFKYLQLFHQKKINKSHFDVNSILFQEQHAILRQLFQRIISQQEFEITKNKVDFCEKFVQINNPGLKIPQNCIKKIVEMQKKQKVQLNIFKEQLLRQLDQIAQKTQELNEIEKFDLIQRYFVKKLKRNISYRTYKYFISILFDKIKTFSQCHNLKLEEVQYYNKDFALRRAELPLIRQNFFQILLENTIKVLQQTTFSEIQRNKNLSQQDEQINTHYSSPTIILNSKDYDGYQFIYKRVDDVPFSIKSLLCSQNFQFYKMVSNKFYSFSNLKNDIEKQFKKEALEYMSSEQDQQVKMMNTFFHLSGKRKFNQNIDQIYKCIKYLSFYRITLDNFYKICYIIQKSSSYVPIIIMGESGVGKTTLIRFVVEEIYEEKLLTFNVHAGIGLQQLQKWVSKIKNIAKENKNERIWAFFDQYNTLDELSLLKEIIIDRRFLGQLLPQNIIFCTAFNPYRYDKINKVEAFKVKPPNASMVAFTWDYKQLTKSQCYSYCSKILQQIQFKQKEIIESITKIHHYIHKQFDISKASLRDVSRFKQLYQWFIQAIIKKKNSDHSRKNQIDEINDEMRAIILSFCFVYGLKFQKNNERRNIYDIVRKQFYLREGLIQKVLQREQIEYIQRLKDPKIKIAYNKAIRENLFTSFVCILNKIPVLLIGPPGSSKSLSLKLINSNLRGKFSHNQFCKQFQEFLFHYLQGSQSSTSQSFTRIFAVANKKKPKDTEYLIVIDEIGNAQNSVHNPTKVLHSLLEVQNRKVSVIALSNTELDRSKMSRFLIIKTAEPLKQQIIETANDIYYTYMDQSSEIASGPEIIKQFATSFNLFKEYYQNNISNYYGLRDFYSALRFLCLKMISQGVPDRNMLLTQAIRVNFDGLRQVKGEHSISVWLQKFLKLAGINEDQMRRYNPSILKMIQKNINSEDSRYLLFFVEQDSIIKSLQSTKVQKKSPHTKRTPKVIYCSPFLKDKSCQQYNIQFTSFIISEMAKGSFLLLVDLINSVQTSLYDFFNKFYTSIGKKQFCRVAIGSTSNPKCAVHQSFSLIIIQKKKDREQLQQAYLNRFEKHFITIYDELTPQQQQQLLPQIKQFKQSLKKCWSKNQQNRSNYYLINITDDALVSLIISTRNIQDVLKRIKEIKTRILNNATVDFDILFDEKFNLKGRLKSQFPALLYSEMKEIRSNITKGFTSSNPLLRSEDSIIYTYMSIDQIKQFIEKNRKESQIFYMKLGQTQKSLKNEMRKAFQDTNITTIQFYLNLNKDRQFIAYILHLAKQIKKQKRDFDLKTIRVIIQINRGYFETAESEISISYLHDYKQYFYDQLLSILTHSQLQLQQNIELEPQADRKRQINYEYFYQGYKLVEIYQKFVYTLTIQGQTYFKTILSLINNPEYRSNFKKIISETLSQYPIEYDKILPQSSNQQDYEFKLSSIKQIFMILFKKKIIPIFWFILQQLQNNSMLFSSQSSQEQNNSGQLSIIDHHSIKQLLKQKRKNLWKIMCKKVIEDYGEYENTKQTNPLPNRLIIKNKIIYDNPFSSIIVKSIFQDQNDNIQMHSQQLQAAYQKQQNQQQNEDKLQETVVNVLQQKQNKILKIVQSIDAFFQGNDDQNDELKNITFNDVMKYLLNSLRIYEGQSLKITQCYIKLFKINKSIAYQFAVLLLNKSYSKVIFQTIIILRQNYTIQELLKLYESQEQQDEEFSIFNRLKQIVEILINISFASIKLQKYDKLKQKYYPLLKTMIEKLYSLIYLSPFAQNQFQQPWEDVVQQSFVFMVKNIDEEQLFEIIEKFLDYSQRKFSYLKITQFIINEFLQNQDYFEKIEDVLRFLAVKVYKAIANTSQQQLNIEEFQQLMKIGFSIANKYASFANLLIISFFPSCFQSFFSSQQQDQKQDNNSSIIDLGSSRIFSIYHTIQQSKQPQIRILKRMVQQTNNFKIAIQLFFRGEIYRVAKAQLDIDDKDEYDLYHKIIHNLQDRQENLFSKYINSSIKCPLSRIYAQQLLKIFFQSYFHIILYHDSQSQKQSQIFKKISKQIFQLQKTQLSKHMLLYLLKHIFNIENKDIAKTQQLLTSKCKSYPQLSLLLQLIQKKKANKQYLLPMNVFDDSQKVFKQYRNLMKNNFDKQIFKQFICDSLKSSKGSYQMLAIFSTLIYSSQQNFIESMLKSLQEIPQLQHEENQIMKTLLKSYLRQRIGSTYSFNPNNPNNFQSFEKSLPLLNLLNLIVAYRKQNCCFMEMFMHKGKPLQNIQLALSDKYIFGTLDNPQLIRALYLQEWMSNKYKYYHHSQTCFYLDKKVNDNEFINVSRSKINGGQPLYKSLILLQGDEDCPLCKNPLIQCSQEISLKRFIQEELKSKDTYTSNSWEKVYHLKGFHEIKSKAQLQQYEDLMRNYYVQKIYGEDSENIEFTSNILYLVQYLVWHILSDLSKMQTGIQLKQLQSIYSHYHQKVCEYLKSKKIQNNQIIPSLYTIASLIEETITDQIKKGPRNLCDQTSKIHFKKNLNRKLGIFLSTKTQQLLKKHSTYSSTNIRQFLQQTGDLRKHQIQYSKIREFKYVQTIIDKDGLANNVPNHLPLSNLINNIGAIEDNAESLRVIYQFISKIRSQFNLKLKRSEANDMLENIIKKYGRDSTKLMELLNKFKDKIRMISQNDSINKPNIDLMGQSLDNILFSHVILDNKQKQSHRMTMFIQSTSKKYNQACSEVEDRLNKKNNNQHNIRYFNRFRLNPTNIQSKDIFWVLTKNQVEDYLDQYSFSSVEYGISKIKWDYDQIQERISKNLFQNHYLMSNKKDFIYFYFIDDDSEIQKNLKEKLNQQLTQTNLSKFNSLFKKDKLGIQQLSIKKISENINLLLSYLKYYNKNIDNLTIGEFLKEQTSLNQNRFTVCEEDDNMRQYESIKRKTQVCPVRNIDDVLKGEEISNLKLSQLYAFKKYLEDIEEKKKQSISNVKNNTSSQEKKPIKKPKQARK